MQADRVRIEFVRGGLFVREEGRLRRCAVRMLVSGLTLMDVTTEPSELALSSYEAGYRQAMKDARRQLALVPVIWRADAGS